MTSSFPCMVPSSTPSSRLPAHGGDVLGRAPRGELVLSVEAVAERCGQTRSWVFARAWELPAVLEMEPFRFVGVREADLPRWLEAAAPKVETR